MIQLNSESYFLPDNKALTNSKIGDWHKCPNYFYRKHILGEVEKTKSKAFSIGDATDNLITELISTKNYAVCEHSGATKLGKIERAEYEAQGKIILSKPDYEMAMSLAIAVEETDAYKKLLSDGYKLQDIIQMPIDGGEYFSILAGKPDFYLVDGDVCTIVDLKTTTDLDPEKYFYACRAYGYFRQLAIYAMIIAHNNPQIKEFRFKHLAVAKIKDIFPVAFFTIANARVEMEQRAAMETIKIIASETEFKKFNPSFDNATTIGSMWDED